MFSRRPFHAISTLVILAAGIALPAGCGDPAGASAPAGPAAKKGPADFGIEVVGIHVSAGGYMLDFRYRVTDPARALPILDRRAAARLTDEATGAVCLVPSTPKVGALRQTAEAAEKDRVYFVLFANPGAAIKAGARVSIDIGELHVAGIVVR